MSNTYRFQRGSKLLCSRAALSVALCAAGISLISTEAAAQIVPDAGSIQRELRQGLPGGVSQPVASPITTSRPTDSVPGETVHVASFKIEGATLLPPGELTAATQAYAGRDLTMQDLKSAAEAVADAYRRRGFFARTVLPPQDVTSGTVIIRVLEGRFGHILLNDRANRANGSFVEQIVGGRLTGGAPYSAQSLERGLLIANDLPGVRADAILKAGSASGTSDLALTVTDTALVSATATADNGGVESTGIYRGIASIAVNNVTGRGDQITLVGLGSRHLGYGQLGWSMPIGSGGWRTGIYASYMRYTLGGDFADLDGRGNADTQGVEVTYPIIRSSAGNLQFRAAYEHGHYHDDLLGEAAHRKQLNRVSLSLRGDSIDNLAGGGRTRFGLTMTMGSLDLGGLDSDKALDSLTTRANGGYGKLEADLTRDQRITGPMFLRLRATGQWAMSNLDSSEQIALGGPYAIRAFPVNEAMGDRGAIANVELHWPVGGALKGLDLYGFVDGGVIQLHARTWAGWNDPGADNVYNLAGAGAGVSYVLPYGFSVSAVVAAPITDNPGGADGHHNQDGSRRNARGWFTISKTF